jgi:hypothetical protein
MKNSIIVNMKADEDYNTTTSLKGRNKCCGNSAPSLTEA